MLFETKFAVAAWGEKTWMACMPPRLNVIESTCVWGTGEGEQTQMRMGIIIETLNFKMKMPK